MNDEVTIQAKERELQKLWDRVQALKNVDPFAAAIAYTKYRQLALEIPPSIPEGHQSSAQMSFPSLNLG